MSSTSVFQSSFSAERWVHQMNKSVSEQVTIDVPPPPICVFRVPTTLVDAKPEAYIPQQIGLGPYHHFHTAMQKVLRFKLAAVKKVLTQAQIQNFQSLVIDKLKDIEPSIRACYDEYLDLDGNALAWIMALDGLFLLYRLGYGLTTSPKFNPAGGKSLDNTASDDQILDNQTPPDATSSKSQHPRDRESIGDDSDEIRIITEEIEALESPISWKNIVKIPEEMVIHPRDILMLENQIPFLVLNEIQNALHLSSEDNSLDEMLAAFAEEHSVLQLLPRVKFQHDASPAHLLDFMYQLVVSNIKPKSKPNRKHSHGRQHGESSNSKFEGFKTFLNNMKQVISIAFSDDSLPKPLLLLKNIFFLGSDAQFDTLLGNSGQDGKSAVEEIRIPSVHELSEVAGVTFSLTPGGIRDIRYDDKELIFYLPMISMHQNSEIILRNMIAYEQALILPGSTLELTEYVELMCGIVDTEKDVELLREKGIIKGDLSNNEVANLFNGIPRYRYHPSGISDLRRACRRVRRRFNSRPIVKAWRFTKKQLIIWWKVLFTLSVIAIVLLVLYQQVCQVYGCSTHIFGRNWQQPLIKRLYGPM